METDDAAHVARLAGQEVSLRDVNVVFVDHADANAQIIRTLAIDPTMPPTPALYALLKREPVMIDFLQCDLFRADPLFQTITPEYRQLWMAVHPCGS